MRVKYCLDVSYEEGGQDLDTRLRERECMNAHFALSARKHRLSTLRKDIERTEKELSRYCNEI